MLTDLPTDPEFELAPHEWSVAGIATGWAIANEAPLPHTADGLGNAVGALAASRVTRRRWWSWSVGRTTIDWDDPVDEDDAASSRTTNDPFGWITTQIGSTTGATVVPAVGLRPTDRCRQTGHRTLVVRRLPSVRRRATRRYRLPVCI